MARFDVYALAKGNLLVMDAQADILSSLKTRVVIPLQPLSQAKQEVVPRLKPVVKIKNKDYVLITTDISTVRLSDLGEKRGNLEPQRQDIIQAVDFLFQGF